MDHHVASPRLLDGLNMTLVGGPSKALPPANVPAEGAAGQGAWSTLVKLPGDVADKNNPQKLHRVPIIVTASLYVERGTGPVIGRALFGAANGSQQVIEFDIQLGFPLATTPNITQGSASGGTMLTLPASSLQVDARNDANYIVSGPVTGGALSLPLGIATSVPLVTGSIAEGPRSGSSQLTRTIYGRYQAVNGLTAGNSLNIAVPAFAQRFRVFRLVEGVTVVPAIAVSITDANFVPVDGPYTEAAGAPPATYRLPGAAAVVTINNTGPSALKTVGCIFELGV